MNLSILSAAQMFPFTTFHVSKSIRVMYKSLIAKLTFEGFESQVDSSNVSSEIPGISRTIFVTVWTCDLVISWHGYFVWKT